MDYCSQLGQSAFREGEKTMALVERTTHSMIQDDGDIAYLLELLDDPEEAELELMPAIEMFEKGVQQCVDGIKTLSDSFEYWYWVISCLRTAAFAARGTSVIRHFYCYLVCPFLDPWD